MKLFTIGYQNSDIDDFADFLRKSKIKQVVDVRKNAASRKRGFSKNKLAEQLQLRKIAYLHIPSLGVPSEWRKLAKLEKITRTQMFKDYKSKILPTQKTELTLVLQIMGEKNTALLCFETDHSDCHRFFVAQRLQRLSKEPIEGVHLYMPQKSKVIAAKKKNKRIPQIQL
jgi:uncharacterized protein (DUF488 family)